jgi:hypothetical protein
MLKLIYAGETVICLEHKTNVFRFGWLDRNQWSTGLGFDGLLQKACLVVGLSRLMDKPIAKSDHFTPIRYTPMRYTPIRYMPKRYTSMRYTRGDACP